MRSHSYDEVSLDPAARRSRSRRVVREVVAEPGLVVEDRAGGFRGAVVRWEHGGVVLEDRRGRQRVFAAGVGAFLLEGEPVTLGRPRRAAESTATDPAPSRSASGSVRVAGARARTARDSRIWVEGVHDAELVERVWGHDLRVEGVVVEPLDGVDGLAGRVAGFGPGPGRRLGVLVDHLVAGSKESRLADGVGDEFVLVAGHPYVDIWQAVKPASVGIAAWPEVPRGVEWKRGVCAELGWGDPRAGWRRVLSGVRDFRDVEPPLLGAMERLIDFVTSDGE